MYRILGRICYGLSAVSIVLSLGAQLNRNTGGRSRMTQWWPRQQTENNAQRERQSIFFGLWAPTLAIAGKVLEDLNQQSLGEDLRMMLAGKERFDGEASAEELPLVPVTAQES